MQPFLVALWLFGVKPYIIAYTKDLFGVNRYIIPIIKEL